MTGPSAELYNTKLAEVAETCFLCAFCEFCGDRRAGQLSALV